MSLLLHTAAVLATSPGLTFHPAAPAPAPGAAGDRAGPPPRGPERALCDGRRGTAWPLQHEEDLVAVRCAEEGRGGRGGPSPAAAAGATQQTGQYEWGKGIYQDLLLIYVMKFIVGLL